MGPHDASNRFSIFVENLEVVSLAYAGWSELEHAGLMAGNAESFLALERAADGYTRADSD